MSHDSRSTSTRSHLTATTKVRFVLVAALLVSVAANMLAAEPTVVGRAVAAWPPIALLLLVDVLGRTPRSSGWLGRLVALATASVAGVAAVASFWHMRAVALSAGESELVAVLFPLTVDGLAVVCSAALVELSRSDRPAAQVPDLSVMSVESPGLVDSTVPISGSQRSLPTSTPALVGGGLAPALQMKQPTKEREIEQ